MLAALGVGFAAMTALQGEAASLVGTVRDAESGRPLAGAVVALPDLNRAVITDPSGHYLLRQVGSGPQHIVVRSIGYAPRTLHALVPPAGELEINIVLRPEPTRLPPLEVRAAPVIAGIEPDEDTEFPGRAISRLAMTNHPLLAEPDPFLAVAGGGVTIQPESPNGVHIRGAAADQTGYLLDGIPALSPYHSAGLFGAWNPDAVERVRVTSSAVESSLDAVGGVVSGMTRSPGSRLRAEGSAGTTQGRLTIDGPLGLGGTGFLLGLRSGFTGLLAPRQEGSYLRGGNSDWLAKVEGPLLGGRWRAIGFGGEDEIGAVAAAGLPEPGSSAGHNDFEWHSYSVGAQWQRTWSGTTLHGLGWSAASDANANWASRQGPLQLKSTRADRGFLVALERRTPRSVTAATFRIGGSTTRYQVDRVAGSAGRFPETRTPVATAILNRRQDLSRTLTIELGAALGSSGGQNRIGPHVRLAWRLADAVTASVSLDRLHQYSQSVRNPESIVGNIFPVDLFVGSGTAGVPVARSDLGILAIDSRPAPGVRLSGQLYRRRSTGLVLAAPRGGEPFSTGDVAIGRGTAHGLAFDAAISARRFGVVASYGYQQVRLGTDVMRYRPSQGATHSLDAGVIIFPSASASFRIGLSGQNGRYATAAAGGFEWEACNLRDRGCEFGGSPYVADGTLGRTALPGYLRLDAGFRKHWHLRLAGRDASLALFGTFSNLLGRRNLLTYAIDPLTGDRSPIEMRPRAPLVVGLDWRF